MPGVEGGTGAGLGVKTLFVKVRFLGCEGGVTVFGDGIAFDLGEGRRGVLCVCGVIVSRV